MATSKKITLHPLDAYGNIDTTVNLYPSTRSDHIITPAGTKFEPASLSDDQTFEGENSFEENITIAEGKEITWEGNASTISNESNSLELGEDAITTSETTDLGTQDNPFGDIYSSGNIIGVNNTVAVNNIESNANKVASITSANKGSTTNYPSNKAIVDYVGGEVERTSGHYVTSDAAGNAFATAAALTSATTFYSGGVVYTPVRNDFAIVRTDESHENATTRYSYQGTSWQYQYKINETPLTPEQLLAVNSGITSGKVQSYDGHISNADIHVSLGNKATWNGKSVVSVSGTGTSTTEVKYITVNGTESKLPDGSDVTVSATGTSTDVVKYITIDGVEKKLGMDDLSAGNGINIADRSISVNTGVVATLPTESTTYTRLLSVNPNAITQSYTRASLVPQAGDVPMYGANGTLSVGTPSANTDAATKSYVDGQVATKSSVSGEGVENWTSITINNLTKNIPTSTVDQTYIATSANAASGKAVYQAIDTRQSKLTPYNKLNPNLIDGLQTVATTGSYNDLINTPDVDQTYNASSTNAQSGTAVAEAISTKVDKYNNLPKIVYATNAQSEQISLSYGDGVVYNTIVSRDANGRFKSATPTDNSHVATKGYVDNEILSNSTPLFKHSLTGSILQNGNVYFVLQNATIISASDTPIVDKLDEVYKFVSQDIHLRPSGAGAPGMLLTPCSNKFSQLASIKYISASSIATIGINETITYSISDTVEAF